MVFQKRRALRSAAVGLFFLLAAAVVFPANIAVPSLELITRGYMDSGAFILKSYGKLDVLIGGGYKFGASFGFNFENADLEKTSTNLVFDHASIIVRDLFSIPLDVSYFIGKNVKFGTGDDFVTVFGTAPIASTYRGYMYFPNSFPDPCYDGIYQVRGTGAHIDFAPKRDTYLFSLYAYEDTHPDDLGAVALGIYSGDFRFMANLGVVKIESFVGATFFASGVTYGSYRGGLMFYVSNPGAMKNVELFAQIGIPKYDPVVDTVFSANIFYLLFEPRLHLGLFSIVPTFFWHPVYYENIATGEAGAFDVNLNMFFGDLVNTSFRGGIESNFSYSAGSFITKVAPYVGFTTPGAIWTIRCSAKVWPFDLADMFEGYIGVKAEL